jgi:hypothetical protein
MELLGLSLTLSDRGSRIFSTLPRGSLFIQASFHKASSPKAERSRPNIRQSATNSKGNNFLQGHDQTSDHDFDDQKADC